MLRFSAVANIFLTTLVSKGVTRGYREGRGVNSQVRNGTYRHGSGWRSRSFKTAAFNHSATPPQIQNSTFFNVTRSGTAGQFARTDAVHCSHPRHVNLFPDGDAMPGGAQKLVPARPT